MSVETLGADTTGSIGTAIAAPGATNTKTGWQVISASTGISSSAFLVAWRSVTANGDTLFDIGIGGAGAESVIIADVMSGRQAGWNVATGYYTFPRAIPSGTRVSARFQSTIGTQTGNIIIYNMAKDSVAFHDCTSSNTYGAATGDSGAVSVDPGASVNTKAATYTEITSSTSQDSQWIAVVVGNQNNTIRTDASWLIDIAVGAASSESNLLSNLVFTAMATTDSPTPTFIGPFPIVVASGSRLSARAQCSINDATDRLLDLEIITFSGAASGGGASFYAAIR